MSDKPHGNTTRVELRRSNGEVAVRGSYKSDFIIPGYFPSIPGRAFTVTNDFNDAGERIYVEGREGEFFSDPTPEAT
jgi:hypothetical protein